MKVLYIKYCKFQFIILLSHVNLTVSNQKVFFFLAMIYIKLVMNKKHFEEAMQIK